MQQLVGVQRLGVAGVLLRAQVELAVVLARRAAPRQRACRIVAAAQERERQD